MKLIPCIVAEHFSVKLDHSRDQSERELQRFQQQLERKDEQLRASASDLSDKEEQVLALKDVSNRLSLAEGEKSSLQVTIQELQQRLTSLAQTEEQLQEVRDQLRICSKAPEEMKAIAARCAELEAETHRLGQTIKDLEAETFVAQQGKQEALDEVSRFESSIKALEEQLVHDEEVYEKIVDGLKEEKA